MRLCFIADLNSIHSRRFIGFFAQRDHDVLVLSTTHFPHGKFLGAEVVNLPGARSDGDNHYSEMKGGLQGLKAIIDRFARSLRVRSVVKWNHSLFSLVAHGQIAYVTAALVQNWQQLYHRSRDYARACISKFQPDLLQCLRLPMEGFIGAYAEYHPTLHFCWGNDLTLWASSYPEFAQMTRLALAVCDGFFADCQRDVHLAHQWGLDEDTPAFVTPGGGGLNTDRLPENKHVPLKRHCEEPLVFFTLRGLGSFSGIDNLPIIKAVPYLSRSVDDRFIIRFLGNGEPYYGVLRAEARRLGVAGLLEFIPRTTHGQIPAAIARADFVFSASHHDGTPNSLLETMWYGGIPICSDLASIREWITDGVNGYLFDMGDPERIAAKFAQAVAERDRHDEFRAINRRIIAQRADYQTCMTRVESIYRELIGRSRLQMGAQA